MSSESKYRSKRNRGSPLRERDEMHKRKKYHREFPETDFTIKQEKTYNNVDQHRGSYERRSEANYDDHKRHVKSERHISSSRRKDYIKEEIPEIPGGKWDREEKNNYRIPFKTEPVSDEDIKPDRKPQNLTQDKKPDLKLKQEERESWGKEQQQSSEPEKKEGINLGLSGKLTEDTNTYNGVVISYSQPPEARKPKRRWRWYIFKDDQDIPFLPLHRQSAYLIGRNRKVADIPIDHPSCSKQHAVLQYRLVSYTRTDDTAGRTVKPYLIDLESANGTYINTKRINPKQYYELFEKDVVKFGFSSREYVLLHEGSKDSDNEEMDSDSELSPVSMLRS